MDSYSDQYNLLENRKSVDTPIELPIISKGLQIGLINLETHKIEINNHIEFRCTRTIECFECCSTLRIPVTAHDIDRIEQQGYELDQIVESLSPIRLPSKTISGTTEKVYLLKRKPFDNTCTFLEEKLCNIHEFKPFACRIFPFSLWIIDEFQVRVVIHMDRLCNSINTANIENNNSLEILQSIKEELEYELSVRDKVLD